VVLEEGFESEETLNLVENLLAHGFYEPRADFRYGG
jgi:hypothetical protein